MIKHPNFAVSSSELSERATKAKVFVKYERMYAERQAKCWHIYAGNHFPEELACFEESNVT